MATKVAVGDIRNLALVGHGAAGKTTLADAMLFKAGVVTRRGSVDDGTSVSDYDDEEHKRKFSIDTSILHCDYQAKDLHILDAPGYPDFVGAALGALTAKYLSEGDLTNDELIPALPKAITAGTVIPVLCACGKKEIGVTELMEAIVRFGAPPAAVGENGVVADENGAFIGRVVKTVND